MVLPKPTKVTSAPAKVTSAPPKVKGTHGGPGRGGGRPPGSPNKAIPGSEKNTANAAARRARELASDYVEAAIAELAVLAGIAKIPVLVKSGKRKGDPILEPLFNDDGSPMLDEHNSPVFGPVMMKSPGSPSDTVRVTALNSLIERGAGKATTIVASDSDDPLIAKPTGRVVFSRDPIPLPANANGAAALAAMIDEDEEKEA